MRQRPTFLRRTPRSTKSGTKRPSTPLSERAKPRKSFFPVAAPNTIANQTGTTVDTTLPFYSLETESQINGYQAVAIELPTYGVQGNLPAVSRLELSQI